MEKTVQYSPSFLTVVFLHKVGAMEGLLGAVRFTGFKDFPFSASLLTLALILFYHYHPVSVQLYLEENYPSFG